MAVGKASIQRAVNAGTTGKTAGTKKQPLRQLRQRRLQ